MNVIVQALCISRINIQLDKPFDFDEGLENFKLAFGKQKQDNSLRLVVDYSYSLLSNKNSSILKVEIGILYNLSPITHIDIDDIYICVLSSQEKLNAIVSSIFNDTSDSVEIEFKSYDEIKEELLTLVDSIRLL